MTDCEGANRRLMLKRVTEALHGRVREAHPGRSPRTSVLDTREQMVQAFDQSFASAGGETVVFDSPDAARRWVVDFVGEFGSTVQSESVPAELRVEGAGCPPEAAELGISAALGAAADTGSLVLGSGEGRRLQLLPRTLLVWVKLHTLVERLEEALEAVREQEDSAIAIHSGPSKSADIGQILVTGVHGPARIIAAIVDWNGRS